MKLTELVMIVRNGEFVDMVIDVEFESIIPTFKPLLCISYDRIGAFVTAGIMDGGDMYEFPLTNDLVEQINDFIRKHGLYEEVLEIASRMNHDDDLKDIMIS